MRGCTYHEINVKGCRWCDRIRFNLGRRELYAQALGAEETGGTGLFASYVFPSQVPDEVQAEVLRAMMLYGSASVYYDPVEKVVKVCS